MNNKNLMKKKNFNDKGFFICKKVFEEKFIIKLLDEIYKSKDTIKYFDNNKKLRRVEKLYKKGQLLKESNLIILKLLKKIFDDTFILFKDKFNAKPPNGEGFFAHYDGIFQFKDQKNNIKNGWYEYSNYFINALIALDECNSNNGTIEISRAHKGDFYHLLDNTKKNGTPALKLDIENKTVFETINLDIGDVVFFSHTCPHRSKKNNSNKDRRILYYTYAKSNDENIYEKYFIDKETSKNPLKSLDNR
jgi:ectoine hydroxylase-related dioxygenase (phytanoyl-CoA dioxygenase family)